MGGWEDDSFLKVRDKPCEGSEIRTAASKLVYAIFRARSGDRVLTEFTDAIMFVETIFKASTSSCIEGSLGPTQAMDCIIIMAMQKKS